MMKKVLLIFTIFVVSITNIFSSMSVDEFKYVIDIDTGYQEIDEVYVTAYGMRAVPVYEKPDGNSKILFYLTNSNPVKVVYTQGGRINPTKERNWSSSYLGIILPMEYRLKGYSIGWLDSGYCWWSPSEAFDTKNISINSATSYLENSLWRFIKFIGSTRVEGVACFTNGELKGIYYSTFDKNNIETQKEFTCKYTFSKENILIFDKLINNSVVGKFFDSGKQTINYYDSHFSMKDSLGTASFERINPITLSVSQEFRNKDYHDFVYSFLINNCQYGYRLWQIDTMYKENILELLSFHPEVNKPELISFSIANGVLPGRSGYESLYNSFWNSKIIEIEKKLDKNINSKIMLPDIVPILQINKSYMVTNSVKIKEAPGVDSNVITTLKPYSLISIIQIGEPVVIDGIISNWVKVKIESGDVAGNSVKEGISGWCFAGSLKPVN